MPLCERIYPTTNHSQDSKEDPTRNGFQGNNSLSGRLSLVLSNIHLDVNDLNMYNDTDANGTLSNNGSRWNSSSVVFGGEKERQWTMGELQMIKVIVLVVVVTVLILSTCQVLFKTFSKYNVQRSEKG